MFTTTLDEIRTADAYPNKQDANFLGFNRDTDRWKVDASGLLVSASGLSVELDKDDDSVAIWSSSGTAEIPVYMSDPIGTFDADPIKKPLIKTRVLYTNDLISEIREATIATPSGSQCVVKHLTYNASDEIAYVTETYGVW